MSDFENLVAKEVPRLRRYARALAGDAARADDLVQDTLERAWIKFHLWRPGSDLRAWLFTIMHHIFIRQVQREHGTSSIDEEGFVEPGVRGNQEQRIEVSELVAAIARLSPDQREIVLLAGLEEMSYEDMSRVLSIPMGTVMSRLSRAREKLRGMLGGDSAASASVLKVVK